VGIGHAWVYPESIISAGIGPDVIAHFGYPVVRCAHERPDADVIHMVEYLDYRPDIFEPYGLGTCLFIGHMIYGKELIVTEEYPVHYATCLA
jgi:hypothetical protein